MIEVRTANSTVEPYPEVVVRTLMAKGRLKGSDVARLAGENEWRTLDEVLNGSAEPAPTPAASPPPPPLPVTETEPEPLPAARVSAAPRGTAATPSATTLPVTGADVTASEADKEFIIKRYHDGYTVANAVASYASLVRVLGGAFAIIVVLVSCWPLIQTSSRSGDSIIGPGAFILGLIGAGIVFAIANGIATLIGARASLLYATLDQAVLACPFLSTSRKLSVLKGKA